MACMYILYSQKLDRYYVGACNFIDQRLHEHNTGKSTYTSTGMPWELRYTEPYDTLLLAKRREGYVKRMKSRKYIENLIAKQG